MPVYATIQIPIQFMMGAGQQQIQQLAAQMNQLNAATGRVQGGVQGVARSFGGLFIGMRALGMFRRFMQEGTEAVIDQDDVLTRLKINLRLTTDQLLAMQMQASRTAGSLAAVTTRDVLAGFEALTRLSGRSVAGIKDFGPGFAQAMSNMVQMSGGAVTADRSAKLLAEAMNLTGGFRQADPKRTLQTLAGAMIAIAPQEPERLMAPFRQMATSGRFQNFSAEDMMLMAAFNARMPIGGTRSGGAGMARFFDALTQMNLPALLQTGGTRRRLQAHMGAAQELGLLGPGGQPTYLDPTGTPSLMRLVGNLAGAVGGMPRERATQLIGEVFKPQVAQRLVRAIVLQPELMTDIRELLQNFLSQSQIAQVGLATPRGALNVFGTNFVDFLRSMFGPAVYGLIAPGARVGAAVFRRITGQMDPARPGGTALATGAMASVTGLLGIIVARALASALSSGLVSSMLPRLVGGGLRGLVAFGGFASQLGLIIGAALVAGVIAYRTSPAFRQAVDSFAGLIQQFFMNGFRGFIHKIEHLERRLRGPGSGPLGMLGLMLPEHLTRKMLGGTYEALQPPVERVGKLAFPSGAVPQAGARTDAPATPSQHHPGRSHVLTRMTVQGMIGEIVANLRSEMDGQTGGGATPGSARMYGIGDVPGVGAVVR